jgi:hypothetical protein
MSDLTLAEQRLLAWHTFACRSCLRPVGQRCRTSTGATTVPHAPRMDDIRAWLTRQPEVDELKTQLDTRDTALEQAGNDNDALRQDVSDRDRDLAALKLEVGTLGEELRTARADAVLVPSLRDRVTALTKERDTLRARVAELESPAPAGPWTPAQLAFVARPSGPGYIRLEDIPGVGDDLRLASAHQAADGKVITLPGRQFWLKDFSQTAGADPKWSHGLLVHSTVGKYHCRGFVGSGANTAISMVPMSSHFTETNGRQGTLGTTQQPQNTILFYGIPDVEFGNLVLQGTPQPHYYHGFRSTGDRTHVHHLKTMGAAQGGQNMPPGETYSCAVGGKDSLVEDSEFDGRRALDGKAISSTVVATLAATNPVIRRCHMHDLLSGFGIVQWSGRGLYTEDVWVTRPGTGTSGWNGAHTNHETGTGPIRHVRPHIELDAFWKNPVINKVTRYPDRPPARHQGKFPHFIFLSGTGGLTDPERYTDVEITDPVYDTWGGIPGGFAIMMDTVAAKASVKPKVKINGATLTGLVRPQWHVDAPAIDTSKQYWIGANDGAGSVWG